MNPLRHAVVAFWRAPAFNAIVIVTTGLGIGLATIVYSFVYAILVRPYPYSDPEQLVRVQARYTKQSGALQGVSLLDRDDYGQRSTTLAGIGAYAPLEAQLIDDRPGLVVTMVQVNPATLDLLGVAPIAGRLFRTDEDRPDGDVHKAIIGHALWRDRFAADPSAVGRVIRTDRGAFTIVGVMPEGFAFPQRASIWVPFESYYATLTDDRRIKRRDERYFPAIARIRSGISHADAQAEVNAVGATLEREFPRENDGVRMQLTPLREFEVGGLRPYLRALVGGVVTLLAICCANLAGLLLIRVVHARSQLAIRGALGARRARLVRVLLGEWLVPITIGGLLGAVLAYAGVGSVVRLLPERLPFRLTVTVDAWVLAFSQMLTLATGVLCGILAVTHASRVEPTALLRERAFGSPARSRLRSGLVAVQIALSLVLLICAAAFVRAMIDLERVEPGFVTDGVITARVITYQSGSVRASAAALGEMHRRVLEALRRIPGVTAAAVTNVLPFTGLQAERARATLTIRGQDARPVAAPLAGADVSADYFATMRIPLVRGRLFDASDTNRSPCVAVVNERGARAFWPEGQVGPEVLWGALSAENPYCRIVGVVGDVRQQAAERDDGIELYYPITQWPIGNGYYVARTAGDPERLASSIRRTIEEAGSTMAVAEVKTMSRRIDESLWQQRLWSTLFATFSAVALGLAAVGLYGIVALGVAQRRREIGLRMALGAAPRRAGAMVVFDAMNVVVAGIVLGSGLAFVASRVLERIVGVEINSPGAFVGAAAALVATAVIAAAVPAYRASRIDPVRTLRTD